ncbi:MAG: hypothetical protein K8S25_11900 [Alphaproteobacteria bacterium]|nr:hypothetical protein [Alphaproteobacteria bacterium]
MLSAIEAVAVENPWVVALVFVAALAAWNKGRNLLTVTFVFVSLLPCVLLVDFLIGLAAAHKAPPRGLFDQAIVFGWVLSSVLFGVVALIAVGSLTIRTPLARPAGVVAMLTAAYSINFLIVLSMIAAALLSVIGE